MTHAIDRRRLFEVSALAAVAGAASTAAARAAVAGAAYDVKPMPVDPARVKGLSAKLLKSHHDNNYAGAVKRLNAILAERAGVDWANAPSYRVNGLKREELIAMNSMILHEHYFAALGGAGGAPAGALGAALARDFGSAAVWRAEFAAMAKAEGGGSGWVILTYEPRAGRLVNAWASDHTTTVAGGRPVLVLDMYEHAYHMDYGAKAAAYVEAYLNQIEWKNPAALFERYAKEG